jgi:hypothetical protein
VGIFSAVLEPATRLVKDVLSDPNYREQVTYKRHTGEAFDEALGHVVSTYQSIPLVAARMSHTRDSVKVSSSEVEVGDLLFLFLGETFPAERSVQDLIIDAAGVTYGIKGIDPIFSVAVTVTVSGVK